MTVQEQYAVLFVGLLFLGMLVCLEIGLRLGRGTKVAEGAKQGLGIIEGAMFTLLRLLVAFTFSGAAERFEGRRHLIAEEANTAKDSGPVPALRGQPDRDLSGF